MMAEFHRFQLSIGVPLNAQSRGVQTYASLARILRGDGTVKVFGEAMARTDEAPDAEQRGLEWVGLLIGIISSGAAAKLVHAIAACFQGPRISKCVIRLGDEETKEPFEFEIDGMDKRQLDAAIQALQQFLKRRDIASDGAIN